MCLFRLFSVTLVLVHELIDATSGVNKFQLTGEVRMGSVGDFKLYDGILVTIGVDDGFFGSCAALGEDHVLVGHIFEHNQSVILGMDSFFHDLIFSAVLNSGFINDLLKKFIYFYLI